MTDTRSGIRVVGVAVKSESGVLYALPAPNRHHNVIHMMVDSGELAPITGEQGFILSDGRFARRAAAKLYAEEAGQILEGRGSHRELFSEDLW